MTLLDERFLTHRLRATSIASVAGGLLCGGFFLFHYFADHQWRWDLFSIILTMAIVKQGFMLYYRLTD